jgi:hypothetical protein
LARYLTIRLAVSIPASIDELAIRRLRSSRPARPGGRRGATARSARGQSHPPGTPLAILPLGTENLLARHLEVTPDLQRRPAHIRRVLCSLDAGQAATAFSRLAGCAHADGPPPAPPPHGQHPSPVAPNPSSTRFKYQYPELRVSHACGAERDEPTAELTARWVFVVNLPRYAGGLSFAPQATGTDGLLDVCTFKEGSLWSGLVYLSGVMLGQHESMQDFARVQTRRLRIESTGPAPYQLDGDPGGELPVEIRALPGRLTLLVSPSWAPRHGIEANP